ncbi:MAG TPA: type II toxin-antitoxin system CcdA family antitoxin [Roseiflexaceae bacterium]|jgi:metal-responsive CopG/Arc/MetJ family transcriptional regulator|nr:type II toxin-antitoxin system CcdA family antitoxin [Roseiflexaceae bacterium]
MSKTQRITITLPADLLDQARQASQGNLSQFITNAVREHLDQERRRKLREALIAGYQAHAEEDLETAEAFRYAEDEAVALYVPPYIVDESEEHPEPALAEQDR